jgi:hypothetical protein
MARKNQRKDGVSERGQWSEEILQEAVIRIQTWEIGKIEAQRCYGISASSSCRRTAAANYNKALLGKQTPNNMWSIFSG